MKLIPTFYTTNECREICKHFAINFELGKCFYDSYVGITETPYSFPVGIREFHKSHFIDFVENYLTNRVKPNEVN